MNKPFVVIFDNTVEKQNLETFFEAIRSSYVSKRGNKNVFILSAPSETKAEEIYKNIEKKVILKLSLLLLHSIISLVIYPLSFLHGLVRPFPTIHCHL